MIPRLDDVIILQEIKDFLDESSEGVIYFNLGTVIKSSRLCRDVTKIIINALHELPYKVIMKWEANISQNLSDNIKMYKWLPQEKILGKYIKYTIKLHTYYKVQFIFSSS